jgi:sulfite exporter TauE/SafE
MTPLLGAVFVASLAGSLHCAGMCGGLVVFYAGTDPSPGWLRMLTHAVYNGGRLFGYAILGAAAGALGGAVNVAGSMAGLQRVAMPIAGAVMILWGVGALLHIKGVRLFATTAGSGRFSNVVRRLFSVVARRPPIVRALAVGGLSAILPCGWLWAFVITAAGTGAPLSGALVMAVFWAGSVPILLAVGLGAQAAVMPLGRHAPTLTAVLLVVLGVVAVVRRPPTSATILPKLTDRAVTAEQVEQLDSQDMPCCEDEVEDNAEK